MKALVYDERRGSFSVGSHIRQDTKILIIVADPDPYWIRVHCSGAMWIQINTCKCKYRIG